MRYLHHVYSRVGERCADGETDTLLVKISKNSP